MSIYDTWLGRMYPVDKANHFMRGSLVCAVVDVLMMVVLAVVYKLLPAMMAGAFEYLLASLAVAILIGASATWLAGKLKEEMDQRANDKALLVWEAGDKSTPFVPPHGVEVADWQFTFWGAAPVALPQIALIIILWVMVKMT